MGLSIENDDYEFLWTVGVPYIFASAYLGTEYGKHGMLLCQDGLLSHQFIHKEGRRKLSVEGFKLYTEYFDEYERKAVRQASESTDKLNNLFGKDLTKLSNHELADDLNKYMVVLHDILNDYFYTEYFMTKLIEDIFDNYSDYDFKKIKTNVDRMAVIKFEQRKNLNKYFYKPSVFDLYINEISKRIKLRHNGYNYRYEELTALLWGEDIDIPDRTHVVWINGEEITGEKAKLIINRLHTVDVNVTEIKGRAGNKGHYVGKVKKIDFHIDTDFAKEIKSMNDGDILVSDSTGPEMILACKKAGAIITDEGGIMSHAALVSREFGIPSVIGTKIATRVLKDGDLVEVDAEKGIVKILERAN
jgi:phosphohistidine swiveling domain-containing protein